MPETLAEFAARLRFERPQRIWSESEQKWLEGEFVVSADRDRICALLERLADEGTWLRAVAEVFGTKESDEVHRNVSEPLHRAVLGEDA